MKKRTAAVKKRIFEYLERKLPYPTYKRIRIAYRDLTGFKKGQREDVAKQDYFYSKKRANDKYIIFRFIVPNYMLFAAGNAYAFMYNAAIKSGLIPIIDMELEYDFENYRLGRDNLWDYCFQQDITVEEALRKKWVLVENVYCGDREWLAETCMYINGRPDDHSIHSTMENWREYYSRVNELVVPCWKFRTNIIEAYIKDVKERIKEEDCIVGVFLREVFSKDAERYRKQFKKGTATYKVGERHPMTYSIEETIACIKELIDKWGCNKILLTTMFQESVEEFIKEFGEDKLIIIPRKRKSFTERMQDSTPVWDYSSKERYDLCIEEKRVVEKRGNSISYAEEVLALSQCDYYIGAKGSGGAAALALNGGKYRDIYILPDFHDIASY